MPCGLLINGIYDRLLVASVQSETSFYREYVWIYFIATNCRNPVFWLVYTATHCEILPTHCDFFTTRVAAIPYGNYGLRCTYTTELYNSVTYTEFIKWGLQYSYRCSDFWHTPILIARTDAETGRSRPALPTSTKSIVIRFFVPILNY